MRILTVDVGTGTQDVFLYDSALDIENGYKLVLPSPTMIVHRELKAATLERRPVVLTGRLMGGGPSGWAARDHVRAGGVLYATPDAARTLDDDLDYVQREYGVKLLSDDEAARLGDDVVRLALTDFDFDRLRRAFAAFGVDLAPDAVALAVFDHGNSPPGYSDRQFRFDYLDERCRQADPAKPLAAQLAMFAHPAEAVPQSMTRLQAVADAAQGLDVPVMVMDTAPAAVLGTLLDPAVAQAAERGALVANVGNFHCLAFRLSPRGIGGLFEHHTGEVTREKLDEYLAALANSTLTHQAVFDDMGHGALVYEPAAMPGPWPLAVCGPRRRLMSGSRHQPYFAVPYGDMMLAGCFGLLRAMAEVVPAFAGPLLQSLEGQGGAAPWES